MELICAARSIKFICLTILVLNVARYDVVESTDSDKIVREVSDVKPQEITSLDFPQCCKPVMYVLKKSTAADNKHWKLLFTDLDLPPMSRLVIYGIKENGAEPVPIDAARYLDGAWIRPVVWYDGYAISVEFKPAVNTLKNSDKAGRNDHGYGGKMYVGFKAVYWLDSEAWDLDKPFTNCPPVGDPIQGGRVEVDTLELPLDKQHYRLFCVWQLKPVPNSDLEVYVTLENMTGGDSTVKIHQGLTSSSRQVFDSTQLELPETLKSAEGFYIELSKPMESDTFRMSYGVFKPLRNGEECVFQVEGKSINGFRCEDYCIPLENTCNSIKDCPNGHDEMAQTCEKPSTTPHTFTTTTAHLAMAPIMTVTPGYCSRGRCQDGRCPISHKEYCIEDDCPILSERCGHTLLCVMTGLENCPGEDCSFHQKECPDGSCVSPFEECGGQKCGFGAKKCNSGVCVKSYERCPEDPCPSYKPVRCSNECHYESVLCDGFSDCSSGTDEGDCDVKKSWTGPLKFIFLIGIIIVGVVLGIYIKRRCNQKANQGTVVRVPNANPAPTGYHPNSSGSSQPYVAPTAVIHNSSNQGPIPYQSSYQPYPPPSNFSTTPYPQTSNPSAPPPPYGFAMNNQNAYPPASGPQGAPPAYAPNI